MRVTEQIGGSPQFLLCADYEINDLQLDVSEARGQSAKPRLTELLSIHSIGIQSDSNIDNLAVRTDRAIVQLGRRNQFVVFLVYYSYFIFLEG